MKKCIYACMYKYTYTGCFTKKAPQTFRVCISNTSATSAMMFT